MRIGMGWERVWDHAGGEDNPRGLHPSALPARERGFLLLFFAMSDRFPNASSPHLPGDQAQLMIPPTSSSLLLSTCGVQLVHPKMSKTK